MPSCYAVLEFLVEREANVNAMSSVRPTRRAAHFLSGTAVLTHGAQDRSTPLLAMYHHAERAADMIVLLIGAGANLAETDVRGIGGAAQRVLVAAEARQMTQVQQNTPLHLAAKERAPLAVIEALLEGGADKAATNCSRKTAHELAVEARANDDVIALLAADE